MNEIWKNRNKCKRNGYLFSYVFSFFGLATKQELPFIQVSLVISFTFPYSENFSFVGKHGNFPFRLFILISGIDKSCNSNQLACILSRMNLWTTFLAFSLCLRKNACAFVAVSFIFWATFKNPSNFCECLFCFWYNGYKFCKNKRKYSADPNFDGQKFLSTNSLTFSPLWTDKVYLRYIL